MCRKARAGKPAWHLVAYESRIGDRLAVIERGPIVEAEVHATMGVASAGTGACILESISTISWTARTAWLAVWRCLALGRTKIFLGDAGSIPTGFLAGALGYWGRRSCAWPIWFPALVFSPFIADASVTLIRRLMRGEKFWQAHREHYHQRMVRLGGGHAATALTWYLVMFAGIILAVSALALPRALQWGIARIPTR